VAFLSFKPNGNDNGGPYRGKPSDAAIDSALNMGCEPLLLYARPVPAAVAVPAIDIETILDASTATMCQCLRSRLLASEVRRLRDEVNGLTGSLDRAEKALKEAQGQEQEPVAFWWIGPDGKDNGGPYRGKPSDAAIDNALNMGCEPVLLYARPVPANLVESHQIKRDSNSLEFDGIKTAPAVAVPSDDERLAQAIQNHSPTAFANSVAAINKPAVAVPMGSILQKVMAALAPMLDEDQFATIESIAASGGHEPPTGAVPAEWREVLTELADDLSIELDMRYQSRSHYPSELRKYENEMQLVYRARALLQSAPHPTHSGNAADMVKNADSSAIQHHPV